MLLTPAPDLTFVIGIPFGLLLLTMLVGTGVWYVLGRAGRG
ncbi:MAG: hypothetical protein ACYDAC_11300 [Candidatus Dormibacteria bacterium]